MNHFFLNILCGILVAVCLPTFVGEACSQETSDLVYRLPPNMWSEDVVVEGLASLNWQIKQHQALQNRYTERRDSIAEKVSMCDAEIEALKNSLPKTLCFLDANGRSEMASRAMSQLLDAKLELAAMEASAGHFKKKVKEGPGASNADDELEKLTIESEMNQARAKYNFATLDYEKAKKMQSSGSLSEQSVERSKLSIAVAKMEINIAEAKLKVHQERAKVSNAEKLVESRIGMEPIQAKIKTLEEFQMGLFKASAIFEAIDRSQQERERLHTQLALMADALFELRQKTIELESFKSLLEKEEKKLDRSPDDKN